MNKNRKEMLDDVFDAYSMLAGGNYVSLYDVKAHLTRYSPGAVELFELPGEYIPDGAYDWVDYIHPEDRKRYQTVMGNLISSGNLTYDLTYRVRTRDGNYSLFRFIGAVLHDAEGNPSLIGGIMVNEGLMENTDPVTVLRTEYGFFNDLSAMRKMGQKCVILLIGINRMTQINEEHGYAYGNRILQQIGWLLQEQAGHEGIAYRIEGSKFAILVKDVSEQKVSEIYRKIQRKLKSGISVDGAKQSLTANGGMISVNDFEMNDRTIYTCLNYAYKESKERKHGALVSFSGNASQNSRESLKMIDKIRSRMITDCQGFYLKYQPVFNAMTEEVIGVEALIRFQDEEYGEVLPKQFIPVLEQDFAFEELGIWILFHAMRDGVEFLKKNPEFILGINISSSQLEDDYFPDSLMDAAKQTGFPLERLCLELTKDCRLLDLDFLKKRVRDFQDKGIKILIDDFGSGYASLEVLKALTSDFVKFDIEFVKEIEEKEEDRQDLQRLSELVSIRGTNVCIKGVQTTKMRDILKTFSVRSMQGNFYLEPVSFDEIMQKYL